MITTLNHRGPDDSGLWVKPEQGIALAHKRLAIHDLSSLGHQPMQSPSGRYQLVLNGEIYNFRELQKVLIQSGYRFRGQSDTEVLLATIERWGLKKALEKVRGMFAVALWDSQQRNLTLARDRIGEKPLYYGWQGQSFMFASELKALREHPHWQAEINRDIISLYMRHGYIPAPYSIYKNIYKLLPGNILSISANSKIGMLPSLENFWSLHDVAQNPNVPSHALDDNEMVNSFEQLLTHTIQSQMTADVPVGAFLSGGLDSSTVVALMQAGRSKPVKTYTIGFNEEHYNEAIYAKEVAKHLGTEHTELYVSANDALSVIPQIPLIYDEPFADQSQIPTFLLAEITQQHVSVALSGDGGDELLAGYRRYFVVDKLWEKGIKYLPYPMRYMIAHLFKILPIESWDTILNTILPASAGDRVSGKKFYKLAEMLLKRYPQHLYQHYISYWNQGEELVLTANEPDYIFTNKGAWLNAKSFIQESQYLDMMTYLPDDILVKVDRAAMNVGLETRVPFLDHRVVEFAWQLPLNMKVRDGQGKWILRQVLNRYVPKHLTERPKKGFGVPIESWLRGPLREWGENLLDESRLTQEGFLNPKVIQKKWREHLSGQNNWQYDLWNVLMFQAWLDVYA